MRIAVAVDHEGDPLLGGVSLPWHLPESPLQQARLHQ
jgi:hypothetical protein